MSEIKLTELDFDAQKTALKDFLRNKPEFTDYDFDSSSLSYLLDILSYYSSMNAFYLHMVSNEMFLDTAQDRNNIVSRAKAIGYIPNSKKSSVAYVDVELFPTGSPASIFIPENTRFTSKLDNKTYHFHTREAYTIYPSSGLYKQTLKLYQGIRLTHKFTVDNISKFVNSRFEIPNSDIDTDLVNIKIQKSSSEVILETFKPFSDLNELKPDSKVYFLQEGLRNKYEIYFGDGILGKSLVLGNIVILDYVVTDGSLTNKCNSFSSVGSIGGITNYLISNIVPAAGGADQETEDSIKNLAPLSYQAQNRMITKTDYETIIKKDYPSIDSIRVWGGEENNPKQYGKVFVSIKPLDGIAVSDTFKNTIINDVIKPKNMISIEVEVIDPFYIFIVNNINVNYDSRVTNDSENTIKQTVLNKCLEYSSLELNSFDKDFRFSKFIQNISASHNAIQDILSGITLKSLLYPSLVLESEYKIDFSNPLNPLIDEFGDTCLNSTGFKFNGFDAYLKDDGIGNLIIYKIVEGKEITITSDVGTINYQTGEIHIKKLYTNEILSGDSFIEIDVKPKSLNIESKRNQILVIDENYITINMNDIAIG